VVNNFEDNGLKFRTFNSNLKKTAERKNAFIGLKLSTKIRLEKDKDLEDPEDVEDPEDPEDSDEGREDIESFLESMDERIEELGKRKTLQKRLKLLNIDGDPEEYLDMLAVNSLIEEMEEERLTNEIVEFTTLNESKQEIIEENTKYDEYIDEYFFDEYDDDPHYEYF
jgi:hypothetical protein